MPLVQSIVNSRGRPTGDGPTYLRTTFDRPTRPGNLVMVMAILGGGSQQNVTMSLSGFQSRQLAAGDLQMTVWWRENCPQVSSVTVSIPGDRSMKVRLLEFSGVAQASALDKFSQVTGESDRPTTGSTGTTTRPDDTVVAILANTYTTSQSGFSGGLSKLFEGIPDRGDDADWERFRYTLHSVTTTQPGNFALSGRLSSSRRWIGFIFAFKGPSAGPAKLASRADGPMLDISSTGLLTVFGKLRAVSRGPMVSAGTVQARIGPSNFQYLLGGWGGLRIGEGTPYRVESIEGLDGWDVSTSDTAQPRSDGELRGVDLQTARQVLFRINWDGLPDSAGGPEEIERLRALLYGALRPRRSEDWELIWRHPGQQLKSMYCRPVQLTRELTAEQLVAHKQAFALKAVDPRHYSAQVHRVDVPVSATGLNAPESVVAVNLGNGDAYPVIRVSGPESGADPASRVTLVNLTTDARFDVATTLPRGSTLVGDMPALVTGAPRSPVTVDGQSKYGAWQAPRRPFTLYPGLNELAFFVEPVGAPVPALRLEYRSTWSG